MSLADDLLEQARTLVETHPHRPKQASLRRAISTAYYALFHHLIDHAVAFLVVKRRKDIRAQLGRKFTHKSMKECAMRAARTSTTDLRTVASALVTLQEARHEADYDVAASFSKLEASSHFELCRDAFQLWAVVKDSPEAELFLVELLVGKLE